MKYIPHPGCSLVHTKHLSYWCHFHSIALLSIDSPGGSWAIGWSSKCFWVDKVVPTCENEVELLLLHESAGEAVELAYSFVGSRCPLLRRRDSKSILPYGTRHHARSSSSRRNNNNSVAMSLLHQLVDLCGLNIVSVTLYGFSLFSIAASD